MSKKKDTPVSDTPKAPSLKKILKQIEVEEASLKLENLWMDTQERRVMNKRNRHTSQELGIFYLEGEVNAGTCSNLSRAVTHFARQTAKKQKPITLYINSPGGSITAGFALYDTLRTLSSQGRLITTVVRGYAASMAGVLFLAGDVRLVGSESFVHIHEPSSATWGKLSEQKDDIKQTQRLGERIRKLYIERTNIKPKQYDANVNRTEWWLSSEEAVELGVATNIG